MSYRRTAVVVVLLLLCSAGTQGAVAIEESAGERSLDGSTVTAMDRFDDQNNSTWFTWRHDTGRTGANPRSEVPASPNVSWDRYGDESHTLNHTPVVVGDSVIVTTSGTDTQLRRFTSGTEDWNQTERFDVAPVGLNGTVYGTWVDDFGGPWLTGVDASDGTERWTVQLSSQEARTEVGSPVTDGSTIFVPVAQPNGTLHAIDPANGSVVWEKNVARGVDEVAYADGLIYIAADGGGPALQARYAANGSVAWNATSVTADGLAPVVAGQTVFLLDGNGDYPGILQAVDAETGRVLWESEVLAGQNGPAGAATAYQPAVANGTVYLSNGSQMTALNATTGETEWVRDADGDGNVGNQGDYRTVTTAPVVSDGFVLVGTSKDSAAGSSDAKVVALRQSDGSVAFTVEPQGFKDDPTTSVTSVVVAGDEIYGSATDGSSEWLFRLDGDVSNAAPTGDFAASPSPAAVNESVTLDAAKAVDDDGSITSYDWDIDGDGTFERTGEVTNVSWVDAGTKNVSLRVTDNDGAVNTTTAAVQVTYPPTPVADVPKTVVVDQNVTFRGGNSSDRDGTVESYTWNHEKGSFSTTKSGENATFSYAASGNYTVELTVRDDVGYTNSTTETIEVVEPPNLSVVDQQFNRTELAVNETLAVNATVENTGGATGNTTVTLYANGSAVDTTEVTVPGGATEVVELRASFATTGNRLVNVTNRSATRVRVVREEVTLSLTRNVSGNATVGEPVQFTATRNDTGEPVDATLRIDGATYETGSDGRATVTFDTAGEYAPTASAENTSTTVFWNATEAVTVDRRQVQLTLTANLSSPTSGEPVQFTLVDADSGDPVNGTLTFANGSVRTGDDGVAEWSFDDAGTATVEASADSTPSTAYRNDSLTLDVLARANLSVTNYTVNRTLTETGEPVLVNTTVENTGDVAGNLTVRLYSDGDELSRETVSVDGGNATAVSFIPDWSASGTYVVSVNEESPTEVTVEKTDTNLTLTRNGSGNVTAGETVQFTVRRNDTGEAVDATVAVDGTTYETGVDGEVAVTFEAAGEYEAIASKSNTSSTAFLETVETVNVDRREVVLHATTNRSNVTVGEPVRVTVMAADSGDPVNATVHVGDTVLQTGSDGEAEWIPSSAGEYQFTATREDTDAETYVNDTTTVTVSRRTVTLSATVGEPEPDEPTTIEVNRADTGAAVNATVHINGTEVVTGDDGEVEYTFESAGMVTLTANVSRTDTVRFENETIEVNVRHTVALVTEPTRQNGTVGEEMTVTVVRADTGEPTEATLTGANRTLHTDNGTVTLRFDEPGSYTFQATRDPTETVRFRPTNVTVDVEAADETSSGSSGGGGGGGAQGSDSGASVSVVETSDGATVSVRDAGIGSSFEGDLDPVAGTGVDLGSLSFEMTFEESQFRVEVTTPTESPEAAPILPDGTAVAYFRADSYQLPTSSLDSVTFRFEVAQSTLPDDASPADLTLYRYHDGAWQALETTHVGGTTYEAESPGFSAFALGVEPPETTTETATEEPQTATETTERETITETTTEQTAQPSTQTNGPGFGVPVTVVTLVGVVWLLRRRR